MTVLFVPGKSQVHTGHFTKGKTLTPLLHFLWKYHDIMLIFVTDIKMKKKKSSYEVENIPDDLNVQFEIHFLNVSLFPYNLLFPFLPTTFFSFSPYNHHLLLSLQPLSSSHSTTSLPLPLQSTPKSDIYTKAHFLPFSLHATCYSDKSNPKTTHKKH